MRRVNDGIYVLQGRTNIGIVVVDKGECVIIDSGIDDDVGRKVIKALKELRLKARALINTHSHADHIGGNAFLQRRLGVEAYAPLEEVPFIQYPILEPTYLYGAYPPRELRIKVLMAEPSRVRPIDEVITELPLRPINLSGHSLGMVGFEVGKVLFTADVAFPKEVLDKYVIPYHINVGKAVRSLIKVKDIMTSYSTIVPSHGHITTSKDFINTITLNLNAINEVKSVILNTLSEGSLTIDELFKQVIRGLNVKVGNLPVYFLIRSAIYSFITWLAEEGLVSIRCEGGDVLIKR